MPVGKIKPTEEEKKQLIDLMSKFKSFISPRTGELLYTLAANLPGYDAIIEIGSFKGASTIWLARGSKRGNRTPVYAVDPHVGSSEHQNRWGRIDTFNEFLQNIRNAGVDEIVRPIRSTSLEFAKKFNSRAGLVFIDGDHSYQAVKDDFQAWFPKLAEGGIMAFDDSIGWSGPRRVVRRYVYLSRHFRNVQFLGPITWGVKVERNSLIDVLKNSVTLAKKCAAWFFLEFLDRVRFPKFLRKAGRKIIYSRQ